MKRLRQWLNTLFWQRIFGPHNRTLFRLRIGLRVRWLLIRLWWREDVSLKGILGLFPRPAAVLLVGLGVPTLILWLTGNLALLSKLLEQAQKTSETAMEWREFVQLAILFIGLPAAFILWAFRDHNVQATLENQRKDVNLKAFQEIQLRATGALDEKLPAGARETLQIAALNQLRAFLRGEFGEEFRRPAFELLLAMQQSMSDRLGVVKVREQIQAMVRKEVQAEEFREEVREAFRRRVEQRTHAERALHQLVRSEWRAIWRSGFPLASRTLDLIATPHPAILSKAYLAFAKLGGAELSQAHLEGAVLRDAHLEGADLSFAHLEGADLSGAHLEGANLSFAHLEGADLSGAHLEGAVLRGARLEGADLSDAHLEGADLSFAHLEGADLRGAHLDGADLRYAHLQGADLGGAHLEGASLESARFDDRSRLLLPWGEHSADNIKAAQGRLRALGARHIDDP